MDKTVARLNIEHYRRLLARETDESRRQVIMRRLAEKEAKLVDSKPQERKRRPRQSRIDSEQSKPGPELGPGRLFRIMRERPRPMSANGSDVRPAAPWFPHSSSR